MKDVTNKIAEHINSISETRKSIADKVRKNNPELIKKIKKTNLNGLKICGVDGGFIKKQFHGIGIILRRAVGVCFYFNQTGPSAEYLPSKNPVPEPIIIPATIPAQDVEIFSSLKRVEIEIETAIKLIKEFSPDILVLDGSIVLHPADVPNKKSEAHKTYEKITHLQKKLYEKCTEKNTHLVGASEDSYGKRFCKLLIKNNPDQQIRDLSSTNDTTFLYYLLKTNERTVPFSYSKKEIPVTADLGEWKKQIYTMYIKPAKFDRPLRLDFLTKDPNNDSEKIGKIMQLISFQSRDYVYPSVLTEADARAKLSGEDLAVFYQALKEKLGYNPHIFKLRRDSRPI